MSNRDRLSVLLFVKIALACLLITILLLSVNLTQVKEILQNVQWVWVVICTFAAFGNVLYQDMVLGYVARPFAKIPRGKLLSFTLVGRFFSQFLPSSVGGDVIKAYYLLPYFRAPEYAYAAMSIHRGIGGLATLLVAVTASLIFLPEELKFPVQMVATGGVTAGLVIALLWRYYGIAVRRYFLEHRERTKESFWFRVAYSILEAVSAYRGQPVTIAGTVILSLIATQLVVAMYMLVGISLDVSISYKQALVAATATSLATLLPITPGSLGVSEGAFVAMAGVMGVPAEGALSLMILGRLIGVIITLPGAVLYTMLRREQSAVQVK